jgi:Leucine-rich repeat (LRR) protein
MKERILPVVCCVIGFAVFCISAYQFHLYVRVRNTFRPDNSPSVSTTIVDHGDVEFSRFISDNPDITELFVTKRDGVTEIPPEIGSLSKLESLTIEGVPVTSLPDDITKLHNLKYLTVRFTKLTQLPTGISSMSSLIRADFSHNELFFLPSGIWNLPDLTELRINDNQVTELPPGIVPGSKLTKLDLRNNKITALPDDVKFLQKLSVLYGGGNSIPQDIRDNITGQLPNATLYW